MSTDGLEKLGRDDTEHGVLYYRAIDVDARLKMLAQQALAPQSEQAEFLAFNTQLQESIDSTFAACNSVKQDQSTGGEARALCLAHLKKLHQLQLERFQARQLGDGK